jgi:hypothetical protein
MLAHCSWPASICSLRFQSTAAAHSGALLATRMEYTRSTQRATLIGQGMATRFGFIGLQGNPTLILIALFVGSALDRRRAWSEMLEAS